MNKTCYSLLVVGISICANMPSYALVNGGFESGTPADFGTIDGWVASGNANSLPVGFTRTSAGFRPAYTPNEGQRMAIFSRGSNDFSGSLSQVFATSPGATYKLTIKMGIVSEAAGRKQALEVSVANGDGASILSRVETLVSRSNVTTWFDFSTTFVASGPQTLLALSDQSEIVPRYQSYNTDLLIDNVSLSMEKPGPAGEVKEEVKKLVKFDQWMGTFGVSGGLDGNPDKDAMANGLEYVVGTNPVVKNGSNFMPKSRTVKEDPDGDGKKSRYLLFSHRRTKLSASDPDVGIHVEWRSSTKESWKNVANEKGVVVKTMSNRYAGGVDLVNVYIPRSITKSTKLSARLQVVSKQ